MLFALTTRWNARRHDHGESMIEEILEMGFEAVELGYDLRLELVDGVKKMVEQKAVVINSLHNFCPLPLGAPRGHPELFTMGSLDERERAKAVQHTGNTIRFAAELGARVVVTHAGNVSMTPYTGRLLDLHMEGEQFSRRYEKMKLKLQVKRDKKVGRHLDALVSCLEQLLPLLEETGVCLAIENLPTWEALPTEVELERILNTFDSPHLGYWHDMGHGQIRENLGFINVEKWLERLQGRLAGMHLHDVIPPGQDHVMPPHGTIDFDRYRRFGILDIVRVIEPTPRTPREEIVEALQLLQQTWGPDEGTPNQETA